MTSVYVWGPEGVTITPAGSEPGGTAMAEGMELERPPPHLRPPRSQIGHAGAGPSDLPCDVPNPCADSTGERGSANAVPTPAVLDPVAERARRIATKRAAARKRQQECRKRKKAAKEAEALRREKKRVAMQKLRRSRKIAASVLSGIAKPDASRPGDSVPRPPDARRQINR